MIIRRPLTTILLFLMAACLLPVGPLYAADGGEVTILVDGTEVETATGADVTQGGAACDYEGFKLSLQDTESCGDGTSRGYAQIVNCERYYGLYQFGEGALADAGWWREGNTDRVDGDNRFDDGDWTGPNAINLGVAPPRTRTCGKCDNPDGTGTLVSPQMQAFLDNPEAQDKAFHDWMNVVYRRTEQCHGYIGITSVTGRNLKTRERETCTVTLSGILAGGHLCGAGGVCNALRSGRAASDSNGTSCYDYICTHKGYQVPWDHGAQAAGQCSPGSGIGGSADQVGGGALNAAPPNVQRNEASSHYENLNDIVDYLWIAALQLMTETFSTMMMAQAYNIGQFLDAKHQLETQRLFQQRTAQAHKDYHPSEQMCTIGTFMRDLAATDRQADFTTAALSAHQMQRSLVTGDAATTEGDFSAYKTRLSEYIEKYCDPNDNSGGNADMCTGSPKPENINADIDYTRTVNMPAALELDFSDTDVTDDETNVLALMDNLFNHRPTPVVPRTNTTIVNFTGPYMDLRSLQAIRSVARNSMSHIIATKTSGNEASGNIPYVRALMKEMGMPDEDIKEMIGERASYDLYMKVLTQKIYQNPNFYTNLYDKPANVTRTQAAMRAIDLMQNRDIYEALIRREMLTSLMTEMMIREAETGPNNIAAGAVVPR